MHQRAPDEKILFQAIPFFSLMSVALTSIILIFVFIFFKNFLLIKHIVACGFLLAITVLECFNKLIITNQRVILRKLLFNKTIHIRTLKKSPSLIVESYTFKKYEWQRKLLKQDFHGFWLPKASIYFFNQKEIKKLGLLSRSLTHLRLKLFSQKQRQKILKALTEHWQLDQSIHILEK